MNRISYRWAPLLVLWAITPGKSARAQNGTPPATALVATVTTTESFAQAQAAFAAADAARAATAANTKERSDAAQKAAQSALDLAWLAFDIGRFAEANTWFDRAGTLKKEANAALRARWENVLRVDAPKSEADLNAAIARWKQKLATTTDLAQQKTLQSVIAGLRSNRFVVRYGAITMLEQITRDGNDNTAWLGYAQQELQIRRDELADLVQTGASQNERDKKGAQIAKALEGMAWAQQKLGLLDEAEKNDLQALTMRRALPVSLPERELGDALDALGGLYSDAVGDLKKAREYNEAALIELDKSTALQLTDWATDPLYPPEMKAKLTPKELTDHETRHAEEKTMLIMGAAISKARELSEISYIAQETGDYREATTIANRMQAVADALPPNDGMYITLARGMTRALVLNRLTSIHTASGEMELALQELGELTRLKREMGQEEGAASTLHQTGYLLSEQGKYNESKPYYEQARRIYASKQNLYGVISSLGGLAVSAREAGDLDEAQTRGQEALLLARQYQQRDTIAWAARTLASIRLLQKRTAEAQTLLDEAAPIAERGASVSDKIATLSLQGQLLEAQGKPAEALKKYTTAIGLIEGVRATAASETNFSKVKFNSQVYDHIVHLLISLNRQPEAFEYLTRSKSAQLQAILGPTKVQTQDPAIQAKLVRANTLSGGVQATQTQLDAALANPKADPTTVKNLQRVLAQKQGEFYAVLDDIKKKHPEYVFRVEPTDIRSSQKSIPADTIIVQYVPLGEELDIFLFTRTSLKIIQTPGTPKQVWDRVRAVRAQLQKVGPMERGVRFANAPSLLGAPANGPTLEENLTALYDLLIAPIEPDIAAKSTLAFIPTQLLYYLPMQVVAHKVDGHLRYLIEDKNVVYLATTGQISKATRSRTADDIGSGLLAFGDPTGANLPAARAEVDTIGTIFPQSVIFSGAQVDKADVLNDKNWDKRILHFATHGILNQEKPDLSYIVLSPGAAPGDDRLTIREVDDLPLDKIDVVTLSACDTAIGEVNPGLEVMTLAGAFERAGALSIVASLWSVSDDSTKDLMVEFYTQLAAGKNKAEALRAAQLKVMHNPDFAHPYYWAPFILTGDWR